MNDLNKKAFELILQNASDEIVDSMADEIPENVEEHEFSKEFEKKMKKLINSESRPKHYKIAAAFLLFFIISGFSAFQIEAVRLRIMALFTQDNQTHTSFSFLDKTTTGMREIEIEYLEDFEIVEERLSQGKYLASYSDGNNTFTFSQSPEDGNLKIDTENAETKSVSIKNTDVFFSVKNSFYTYMWIGEEYCYTIHSDLDRTIIEKIITEIISTEK